MTETMDKLKLRILICFLKMSPENCTVTGLSKTLAVEKYAVSRAMIALEKEGLMDRGDNRRPKLTPAGYRAAQKYSERMEIALNHLVYEGVSSKNAQADAMYLSMYCSDETFSAIQSMEASYRIRYQLAHRSSFDGTVLCRHLKDGSYKFPFIIYRDSLLNYTNLSMANHGFEHPCELIVQKGRGLVRLKTVTVRQRSALNGRWMDGKIARLQYFDGETYRDTEQNGGFLQFPADPLSFMRIGTGIGCILHGSVCLRMTSTAGLSHMPESTAVFTLLI